MTPSANSQLPEITREIEEIGREAQSQLGGLTARQLNWKPNPGQWSIGQCLDHLITANKQYFPLLRKLVTGEAKKSVFERLPLLPGFFGPVLIKSLGPEATRKFKAPQVFQPSSSDVGADVVESFVAHQRELSALLEETANLDLRRTIITSPASRFVTYSLLDAYRIIIAHEKRHLRQAQNVREAVGFPGAA